jgi:hypothetical protein
MNTSGARNRSALICVCDIKLAEHKSGPPRLFDIRLYRSAIFLHHLHLSSCHFGGKTPMNDSTRQRYANSSLFNSDPCLSGLRLENRENLELSSQQCFLVLARLLGHDETSSRLYHLRRPAAVASPAIPRRSSVS